MFIVRIIFLICIFIALSILVINNIIVKKNDNKPIKKEENHDFCILIPARDESNVIEALLLSIKNQTYKVPMNNVYVIVEDKNDKTVLICKKYNVNVVYRKDLTLRRKGYALNDAVQEILIDEKKYSAYFIFDADNVLDKDFIKNMIPIFDKGYDIAAGYRNTKNGNKSVVAAASSLTFSLINTVFNNKKMKETRNITFSGTGFYIRGEIIEKLGGFPFHELTEDYEISMYAILNNYTTYYNEESVFYDEQPIRYKDTINQRQRWIRGYFDVRKKYIKNMKKNLTIKDKNYGSKIDAIIGVIPYIFIIIGTLIYLVGLIVNLFINKKFLELFLFILLIYFVLQVITFILILLEGNKINLSMRTKLKVLFYNPIYIISFIPCAIKGLTKKEIQWSKVKHGN